MNTNPARSQDWRFNAAPMIDISDRHCRYLFRLLSKKTRLYTEMITCPAILHGDRHYLLDFDESEAPLALQLGGSKPDEFAECARISNDWAYDEININVGCPSDRVQSGRFGACLMKEPALLAECFTALKENTQKKVTIKCRIGVDEHDSDDFFFHFIEQMMAAGCDTYIVHARIAILKGLSPKENRTIPPLDYARVSRLKARYPELNVILNGGLDNLASCKQHLKEFDGVMLGREIYKNLMLLASVDQEIFEYSEGCGSTRRSDIVAAYIEYMKKQAAHGVRLQSMARHLIGLYHGQILARHWRHFISSLTIRDDKDLDALLALAIHIDDTNEAQQSHGEPTRTIETA